MLYATRVEKELYTEQEAAAALEISLSRLHALLDANIFNEGTPRPASLTFRQADLVVLGFWNRSTPNPKIVRMPRRP